MMSGYKNRPDTTAQAQWIDLETGEIWMRMGDIGRVDADGFVELVGRAKDMIISGGFNIYPVDLENELLKELDVREAAVIGMPSVKWGETPVGFVTIDDGTDSDAILSAVNSRLGKTQRLGAALCDRRDAAQPYRQIAEDGAAGKSEAARSALKNARTRPVPALGGRKRTASLDAPVRHKDANLGAGTEPYEKVHGSVTTDDGFGRRGRPAIRYGKRNKLARTFLQMPKLSEQLCKTQVDKKRCPPPLAYGRGRP